MDESSRFIVITGCTRGLGRVLAEEFHALGHRVAGCGTNATLVAELQRKIGPTEDFSIVNVTKPKQVQNWADDLIQRHGAPDLLIANAGVINEHADFCDIEPEVWEKLLSVNVMGVVNTLRAFTPAMMARKTGVIVTLSSGAGRRGYLNIAPYCMSKHAVEGITKSLALELPDTMAAVPVAPGVIDTDMLRSHYGERAEGQASPARWAKVAVPFMLGLGPKQNGESVRIEGY